jgi:mono/diheme cytochrome c family protein
VLFDITKRGIAVAANLPDYRTRMPAFESVLDDADILAVLSFIKAQWPDDIRRGHDVLNERDAASVR